MVEVECDPASLQTSYYDSPPHDRTAVYVKIYAEKPPPEGYRYAGAYNCADRYVSGPHLVADPDWAPVEALRDEAMARVAPPLPNPNVSPSEAVVRTPAWLWVDDSQWQPASASASQGPVSVRVEARPVQVTWDLDEGVQVCQGPGIPWSQGAQDAYDSQPEQVRGRGNPACTFTFANSSATRPDGVYRATVTVTWEFAWWLNGTPRGVFGTVERTSEFDLRVGEVEALITDQ